MFKTSLIIELGLTHKKKKKKKERKKKMKKKEKDAQKISTSTYRQL